MVIRAISHFRIVEILVSPLTGFAGPPLHFPTAPAVGYDVSSLRDFRRLQKLDAEVEFRSLGIFDWSNTQSSKPKY